MGTEKSVTGKGKEKEFSSVSYQLGGGEVSQRGENPQGAHRGDREKRKDILFYRTLGERSALLLKPSLSPGEKKRRARGFHVKKGGKKGRELHRPLIASKEKDGSSRRSRSCERRFFLSEKRGDYLPYLARKEED